MKRSGERVRLLGPGAVPLAMVLLLAGLWCLMAARPATAGEPEEKLAAFLGPIEARAAAVKTLSCQFVQERRLAMFSQPVRFEGRLDVEKPDRLRWEFTAPIPSVLILDHATGTRCTGSGEAMRFDLAVDPIMGLVAEQLFLWTTGDYTSLRKSYRLERLPPAGLALTPLDRPMSEVVSAIHIFFNDALLPQKVEILEANGDRTLLWFSSHEVNRELPDALFSRCKP